MAIPNELRMCPLFFEMYDNEIEKIVQSSYVASFSPGEFVVKDGEEGDEIYVVLEGQLVVEKKTPEGILKIMTLEKGDVFGEMVLLDEKIRSADIKTVKQGDILELKYNQIFELFKKEPRVFGLLLLNMSRMLAKRLRSTNKIIVGLKEEIRESS